MAYQTIVNSIRDAANAINENGTFIHGLKPDGSLQYDETFPQIHLYPFGGDVKIEEGYFVEYNIWMGFWQQDSPDSSVEKREEIIAEMDELCKAFIVELDENIAGEITGIKVEPVYRTLSATLSGYDLKFKVSIAETKC